MASTATAGERPQRSEEELRAASNRLWHEYWMLRCAARLKTEDPMLAAALEETFALHLRNLAAFLYGEFGDSLLNSTIDANAVLAEDFMGPRWFELRPERTELHEVRPDNGDILDVAARLHQHHTALDLHRGGKQTRLHGTFHHRLCSIDAATDRAAADPCQRTSQ